MCNILVHHTMDIQDRYRRIEEVTWKSSIISCVPCTHREKVLIILAHYLFLKWFSYSNWENLILPFLELLKKRGKKKYAIILLVNKKGLIRIYYTEDGYLRDFCTYSGMNHESSSFELTFFIENLVTNCPLCSSYICFLLLSFRTEISMSLVNR